MSAREGLADLAKEAPRARCVVCGHGHGQDAAEARAEARAQIEAITEALQHMSLARLSLPHDLRSTLDEPDTKLRAARERWEWQLWLGEERARRIAGLRVGGAQ